MQKLLHAELAGSASSGCTTLPGKEGSAEGGAKQSQQGVQILLCMCIEGSQAISHFCQLQSLTSKSQPLQPKLVHAQPLGNITHRYVANVLSWQAHSRHPSDAHLLQD